METQSIEVKADVRCTRVVTIVTNARGCASFSRGPVTAVEVARFAETRPMTPPRPLPRTRPS